MSRFYVGQPVVCVWSMEDWMRALETTGPPPHTPAKGARYTISRTGTGYSYRGVAYEAVGLVEMPQDIAYRETAFAPITENQVQAIIAMATDVPEEMEVENA